ncbi:MAG: hypothetical protein NTY19_03395 [Planctomycetota bacterium]|nr:hypothetical protein [Planctomycetota bacterium]
MDDASFAASELLVIRRDCSLNLASLRTLKGANPDETQDLQRYILGLALLAFTATPESTLRQGCQLLPKGKANWKQFKADGEESGWNPESLDIAGFASAADSDFGVVQPPDQPLVFDKNLLKASIDADAKKKADKKAVSAGNPIDNIKKLVNDLEPARGDKFSEAKTKPLAKLQDAVAAIEADAAATDELKALGPRSAEQRRTMGIVENRQSQYTHLPCRVVCSPRCTTDAERSRRDG